MQAAQGDDLFYAFELLSPFTNHKIPVMPSHCNPSAYLLGNFTWQRYSLVSKNMNHSSHTALWLNSNGISIQADTADQDCYFDHVGTSSFIFSRKRLNRFLTLQLPLSPAAKRGDFSMYLGQKCVCCAGVFGGNDVEKQKTGS